MIWPFIDFYATIYALLRMGPFHSRFSLVLPRSYAFNGLQEAARAGQAPRVGSQEEGK